MGQVVLEAFSHLRLRGGGEVRVSPISNRRTSRGLESSPLRHIAGTGKPLLFHISHLSVDIRISHRYGINISHHGPIMAAAAFLPYNWFKEIS